MVYPGAENKKQPQTGVSMSQIIPWHVLIVDDHPLMRRGLRQLLETDARFRVTGEASSGAEAITQARALAPDVILLDLNMRGLSGLDTLTLLRRDGVSARIIVLTVSDARSSASIPTARRGRQMAFRVVLFTQHQAFMESLCR